MKFKYRRYYLYYLARVGIFLISFLPPKIGLFIAEKAGYLAYLALPKYRNITIENLTQALKAGEAGGLEVRTIARQVFGNLGKNSFELIRLGGIDSRSIDSLVKIQNREILDEALKPGYGVIIVTGHFGNWELMPITLKLKGYQGAVVGRRIYFERYDRYLNALRKLHGVEVIYRDESPRKILRILRSNGIVGIVADQDADSVEGVFVDFLGKSAYTPVGPVALAKVSGAALIPAFMIRRNGSHTLVFEPPIELADTPDREKDMIENTARWSSVVESYIRRYPEQWVWMHRRWKTQRGQECNIL